MARRRDSAGSQVTHPDRGCRRGGRPTCPNRHCVREGQIRQQSRTFRRHDVGCAVPSIFLRGNCTSGSLGAHTSVLSHAGTHLESASDIVRNLNGMRMSANDSVERMAAGAAAWTFRERLAAAIAHFFR